ncbi:MAG: hypothetical protein EOM03_15120 [Clostridia bacterium]|nr:hypothetical protein [Clostridia bacterium]
MAITKHNSVNPPPEASNPASSGVASPASTGGGPLIKKNDRRFKNLTGKKFSRWTVLGYAGKTKSRASLWLCRCACGTMAVVVGRNLTRGTSSSCGCYMREKLSRLKRAGLVGLRFGRLQVLSFSHISSHGQSHWNTVCDCGNKQIVSGTNLTRGLSQSCGCYQKERASQTHRAKLLGKRFGRLKVLSFHHTDKEGAAYWKVICRCGNTGIVLGKNLLRGDTTSCGCYAKELLRAKRGRKNPNWNPQLTEEDRGRRRLGSPTQIAWKTVAQKVRTRDKFLCCSCGKKGVSVHHIIPWASSPGLRFDPANLITLCRECHRQLHALYGNDCDLEDLKDFLAP